MNPLKPRILDSYSPAVIRLLLGAATLLLRFIPTASQLLNILFIIIAFFGLSNMISALMEMLILHELRKKQRLREMPADVVRTLESRLFPVEKVLASLEKDPVLTLQIISDDRLLLVGSTSNCREVHDNLLKSHTEFFDTVYYIDEEEYSSIEDFRTALTPYVKDGMIAVHKIDDLSAARIDNDPFGE